MPTVDVAALPDHIPPRPSGAGPAVAVVVDVLRATTMMTALLDAGARGIRAVRTTDQARAIKAEDPSVILGGERDGLPPEGFDLGNSPATIEPAMVRGRTVVLTTTNGTRAVEMVPKPMPCVMLALVNLDAVADSLRVIGSDILIVCSGTDGQRSAEDELAAGLLVAHFDGWTLTERAEDTADRATGSVGVGGGIEAAVRRSSHAARLIELGFEADVRYCSRHSVTRTVPVLDRQTGLIVPG